MLICKELLNILQKKYPKVSEELLPELLNTNIKKGFIDVDKLDIENALINSTNCTFNIVKTKKKEAINILLNAHNIKKSKKLILFIVHNKNLTLYEISQMMNSITKNIRSSTDIIVGDFVDKSIKNQIKLVSLIIV